MEDVWAVGMDQHALFVGGIKGVAPDARTPVDEMNSETGLCEDTCGGNSGKAHAGNQNIQKAHGTARSLRPMRANVAECPRAVVGAMATRPNSRAA